MAEFDIVVEQLTARLNREHKITGLTMAISLVFIGMATHSFVMDCVTQPSLSLESIVLAVIGAAMHITSWYYTGLGRNTVEEIKLHKRQRLQSPPLRELDEPNPQFWN